MLTLYHAIGSIGFFSSRVFIPAFATALLLRYRDWLGPLGDWGLLAAAGDEARTPGWFTSDASLATLGVLSLCEVFLTKRATVRDLLAEVDQYIKPVIAIVCYFGVLNETDAQFVGELINAASVADWWPALLLAGGVFLVAEMRNVLLRVLYSADEDDDAGLQNLLSWLEDIVSFFGSVLLLAFPAAMSVMIGGVISGLWLLERYAEHREQQTMVACERCGEPMYRSALVCGRCGAANPRPTQLTWWGASGESPVVELDSHPYRLIEKKRCPRCASRLTERSIQQSCPECRTEVFGDISPRDYDRHIRSRLPRVLPLTFALSFVPVIGLIPGVIYSRIVLTAPYRRYVPRGKTLLLRWLVRLMAFLLIALQWIPLVGAITVPAIAVLSHATYRGAFLSAAAERQ